MGIVRSKKLEMFRNSMGIELMELIVERTEHINVFGSSAADGDGFYIVSIRFPMKPAAS